MEIKILEESKNKLVFEIPNEDHTLFNILKEELNNDEHVKIGVYRNIHPLTKVAKMTVETDGKESPKDALREAAKRVIKTNKKFTDAFEKAI